MSRAIVFGIALVVAVAVVAVVVVSMRDHTAFNWENSYDAGIERAQGEGRFAIVYLHTDWCSYCKRMEAETFPDQRVREEASRYVWVRLNAEKDAEGARLRRQYDVAGYPTFLVFDKRGRRIDQLEGFLPPQEFLNALSAMTIGPDSLPALEERAAKDPKSGEAQYALASKYLDLNEYKSAAEGFRKAIALDPNRRESRTELAYYHLAVCLASDRQRAEANEALDRFARLYPDSQLAADALILRGQIYYHEGQWVESTQAFESFLVKYPHNEKAPLVRRMLAELHEEMPLRSAH